MNNTTTAQFGFKKSQLSKVNQKICKNILSQKEEQKIKHLVGNKSHIDLPPKINKQLNPIQLKKTFRQTAQRTIIDCDLPSINNNNQTVIKNEYQDVYNFLKDLNMEVYFELFIKNGINSEEKILYLNNDNLKLINIPYAHRARFLKKLKEIETMQNIKKNINEKGGLSKLKLKKIENNNKYEEIIIPKEEDDIERNADEERDSFTRAIYDYQKTHSKFEEKNDKQEFFKTGINNMKFISRSKKSNRYANSTLYVPKTQEMKIGTTNPDDKNIIENNKIQINKNNIEENQNKKSIGIGEEPINGNENNIKLPPVEIGEYIENKNIKIKEDNNPPDIIFLSPKQFFPLNKQKTLCYNCLCMILQEHSINKYDKPFCSLHCLEIFEKKSVANCNCCNKRIEIGDSIPSLFKEKVYYCSPECLQKKEPNENNIINKSQVMEQNLSPTSSENSENPVDILDI